MNGQPSRRGRPKLSNSEKVKTKNITVDDEIQELIKVLQDKLVVELGFKPTISQALRFALKIVIENRP